MVDFERRPVTLKAGLNVGPVGTGTIVGILLVMLGGLLFVDNLDLLPFSVASAFWPLAILASSAIALRRTCSPAVRVFAVTGFVWGALLLLDTAQVIHVRGALLWPLVLIATGVTLLMYRLRWQGFRLPESAPSGVRVGSSANTRTTAGKVEEYAVFSAAKRKVETVSFEGGEMIAVFGSVEVDLRRASISSPDRQAVIEANAAFGSIELKIPESWRVSMQGTAVFGAYEDKTIPPRPDPGSVTPTLVIRGGTAFGAVVVKN